MKPRTLLKLYPRAWRARYGDEFVEILSSRRLGAAAIVDVIGGAIDAWLRPQSIVRSAAAKGDLMTSKLLQRCATGGGHVTMRDQWIGVAVLLGTTLVLSSVHVYLAGHYRGNAFVDGFGNMVFPVAVILTLPCTYLKHQARTAKAAIMLAMVALIALASYLAEFV